jgi:hypothetical protein
MMQKTIAMPRRKNIALVAHDNKKEELVEWVKLNCKLLAEHCLYFTRTTGQLLKNSRPPRALGLHGLISEPISSADCGDRASPLFPVQYPNGADPNRDTERRSGIITCPNIAPT